MATDREQSDLAEVRDQLSLDYADDKYLNVIGNNLGIRRTDIDFTSTLSFDDNTWRALVKVIALQYKQVLTKFEEILEIVLGPKITKVATFAEDIAAGVQSFKVNNSIHLPQVGTVVLDEGLPTEETLEVCYIDRYNEIMYLTTPTAFDHQAEDQDAEQPLSLDLSPGDTSIYVPFSEDFPTADFPYTLVLGRGTDSEEVVQLLGNDLATNILTISACVNSHEAINPSQIQDELANDYIDGSYFLALSSITQFDESGVVLLGPSTSSFTATGGSVNDVDVAASTLTQDRHIRSRVVFEGNITAALAGVEAEISANSDSTITFLTALGTAPVAGDLFTIRPVLEYTSLDTSNSFLNLRRDIADITVSAGTTVELLRGDALVSLGPIKLPGAGWDVYQIDTPDGPPTVEILIPDSLQVPGQLRGNSYFHTTEISPAPSTTLSAAVAADADYYYVTDATDFPVAGVVTLDVGGGGQREMGYSIDHSSLLDEIPATATTATLESGGENFLGILALVPSFVVAINDGISSTTATVTSVVGDIVTFSAPIGAFFNKGASFKAISYIRSGVAGSPNAYVGGEVVTLYQPAYASTDLLDGNLWNLDAVFPGPYLYEDGIGIQQAETELNGFTVAGPSRVMITQEAGRTAIEVEDASAFPHELADLPFSLLVGSGGPNREVIDGNSIAYRQRTYAFVAPGGSIVGATSIVFDNLDELTVSEGLTGGSSKFPDANGYRVRLDPGGPNDEIIFVTSTNDVDTMNLATPALNPHAAGERAVLLADVIATDPLADAHTGVFDLADRAVDVSGSGFPAFSSTRYESAEVSQPVYSSLPVVSDASLPSTGANLYFNFGDSRVNSESILLSPASPLDLVLNLTNSSVFPSGAASRYPFVVTIAPGSVDEEIVEVVGNNTGFNTLTLASPVLNAHSTSTPVVLTAGTETTFSYQTTDSNNIEFTPADTFDKTFYAGTTITVSPSGDIPKANGYDFPFFLPSDIESALTSVLDLVRAAGVLVTFIDKR